ncbi:phosphatidate cytidylyltransferase 5, chloroplastic isoform X1 [Brassica napus]|uniref:phosphatidate cytidylyltransferase 5, chloroplastic isoform X1 n=1 Tax=Brassica napus TaxID=3708 RepID=UPI0020785107|nr:phosphatidate cytidylyltransferase 5, chloroplastic isoform X1 [Brassica napus]
MAPFVEVCRYYKPLPFQCPCRSSPTNSLILPHLSLKYSNLRLLASKPSSHPRFNGISFNRSRVITAVARVESEHLGDDSNSKEEEERDKEVQNVEEDSSLDQQKEKSRSQFKKRVVFGLGIGLSVGGVVLAGGWVFTLALAAAVLLSAREYFELVRSKGIAQGMTPPPRYLSRVCSVICALMPILTLYFGHIDIAVTSAAFVVAMALLLQRGRNPRFSQLSSTMFGLFYCGYLPCFWVKLRCGLTAPVLGRSWPVLLGGQGHWTVGLVAILVSFCGIIASDTFAFLGGKKFQAFGKTPLISISPKKTWEGAVAGLVGCITITVLLSKSLSWPQPLVSTIAFGVLNFLGSVFGDLTESMIKRDAGVKDSGSLIPGHGGILDRVDSYIFTGALAYSFVRLHGV